MSETLCTDPASPPGRTGPAGRPGPSHRGWTLALASAGAFMAALDVVVVSTALPTLHSQLGASLSQLEWTINAYSLVFGCLMLTGAALGDRFGRRRMYVTGLLVFVFGSALAAVRLTESRGPRPQLDIAGLLLAGAGLFALTWAPVRAPSVGWGSA